MSKLDAYLIQAKEKGFVTIKNNNTVLTEAGEKELNDITMICFKMVEESNSTKDFITKAADAILQTTGQKIKSIDLFKEIMYMINEPSPARLLAFLMHEKDNDYKYLKTALSEDLGKDTSQVEKNKMPGKPALSVVKKQKYDA